MPMRDENMEHIEQLLARLPMREPSAMLDARVAETLHKRVRPVMPWLSIAAGVLLAGAVTLTLALWPAPPTPDSGTPIAQDTTAPPDTAPELVLANHQTKTLNFLRSRDVVDEARYTPTGQPYRVVVREVVDHQAWVNPETGVSGVVSVPRQELIVVTQNPF